MHGLTALALFAAVGPAFGAPFFATVPPADQPPAPGAIARGMGMINIDLAGMQSWGLAGSPENQRLSIFVGSLMAVVSIGWDNVVIQTAGGSPISDARINFLDSPVGLNLTPGVGDNFPGTGGPYSSGGLIDLASLDPTFPFVAGADGMLHLEFFEFFDDEPGAPDAVWVSGTLSINFPAPGGVCVLLMGTLATARRRR